MSNSTRRRASEYMEWAKLHSQARYNLATSGILSVPASEFPWPVEPLEINAAGSYGFEPLQDRIARHSGVAPECVVAAAGASMANHLAMAAILNPGDELVIEDPAYEPLLDVADYLQVQIKRFPRPAESAFAVDPDRIGHEMTTRTRLIVLSNLHNPSGALISAEVLRAIGEIAQKHGALVLVDEVYLELLDDSASFSFPIGETIRSGGGDNPFIATNSLTKGYGLSGLRCGWILASPPLARRIWRLNDLFGVNAAHPAEQLSVRAFDHLDTFRQRARSLLTGNRQLLDRFLDSRGDLECFRPVGGTVVFPRLLRGDSDPLSELLRRKFETSVVPGKFFERPNHFRIGIGGKTDELRAGLERIAAALDQIAAS